VPLLHVPGHDATAVNLHSGDEWAGFATYIDRVIEALRLSNRRTSPMRPW